MTCRFECTPQQKKDNISLARDLQKHLSGSSRKMVLLIMEMIENGPLNIILIIMSIMFKIMIM